MNARQALDQLVSEDGRKAVLRSELLMRSDASASSCDRALRTACDTGTLVRVGQGIYGIGRARVFEIVPEVMPKLGYRIEPGYSVKGYSQKTSGNVWTVNKKCQRKIRKKGVHAFFKLADGQVHNQKEYKMPESRPTRREIEDHNHDFERCHSLARAEKDLIVRHALRVYEEFDDRRAVLAIEGGTALAYYHRLVRRFSEDLDIRIILSPEEASRSEEERIETAKEIGQEFRRHMHESMPYLTPTKKGRIRKDAVVQALIFNYDPIYGDDDDEVVPGVKVELVYIPVLHQLRERKRFVNRMQVIHHLEIAAGKWQALAGYLPERGSQYPDLVRHVHDLASLCVVLEDVAAEFHELAFRDVVTLETIEGVVAELQKSEWKGLYEDYMRRMGTSPISPDPGHHLEWSTILQDFGQVADLLVTEEQKRQQD